MIDDGKEVLGFVLESMDFVRQPQRFTAEGEPGQYAMQTNVAPAHGLERSAEDSGPGQSILMMVMRLIAWFNLGKARMHA